MTAPLPGNEADRLVELHSYGVLDTLPEQAYDDIAGLAALICHSAISLVSLVDDKRQWFKARFGLTAQETPREIAFCAYTILQDDLMIVPDAALDPRFADNPLVTGGPLIRFYAGAPLTTPGGHNLGTLCVIDRVPRDLTPLQREALRALARQVMAQLELRRRVAELERAREARQRLEEQLRQAHMMEAVGRLAGGVAHDFNNLLTVILGYGQFLLDALPERHEARGPASEVIRAAERAALLTRQLLAFGRRQILQPKRIDLNALVNGLGAMFGRLIGKDIEFRLDLSPDLPWVFADPAQIEQVVMNLVVNAREAMPGGGKLLVQTRREDEGEPDSRPGPHVRLTVRDSGRGMDRDTLAQAFEPFFTTKPVGEGSGLGLSMVGGVVAQSGGHVAVESALGSGTAFHVYLPAAPECEVADQPLPILQPPGGRETVLLVEDEDGVRELARGLLRRAGYAVLEAADGEAALRAIEGHAGPIGLLVTDVVMPGMNGVELARRLRSYRPGLPVLFISGYADEMLTGDEGRFLAKPFAIEEFVREVREALDARPQ